MVISLTGFMGCGKSSVGRELATLLDCPAVDLDGVIEQRSGRKIPEIFETEGETAFRKMELEALREILDSAGVDLILSLGGGTLTTPECTELVHEKTTCIYLRATIDTLVENLEEDGTSNRPMLKAIYSQNSEHSPIGAERPQQQDNSQHENSQHENPQHNGNQSNSALRDRITELMAARKGSYEKTAHHIIDIDGETPSETAHRIAALFG